MRIVSISAEHAACEWPIEESGTREAGIFALAMLVRVPQGYCFETPRA